MTSRNASYTLFGWDFQVNAAIFIFLKNLKDIDKVRLEGKLQDIEFIKKDKSKIFAQAKSIYRYDDYTNVIANLKSALQSLDEAQGKDPLCNEVIYVTNTPNPFNKDMGFFGGVTKTNYDGLPDSCKAIVDSIRSDSSLDSLNTQQFSIQVIPFHGEDLDNRYKYIKDLVNEFLASLGLSTSGFAPSLLQVWHNEIFKNGTIPDTDIHIKKSELIWPLIFLVTDQVSDDWLSQELDEGVYEEVKSKYRNLISNATDRFETYTKVVSDYRDFTFTGSNREKIIKFISESWEKYKSEIDTNNMLTDEEQEYVIKIVLHKIIVKKDCISRIKIGAGL